MSTSINTRFEIPGTGMVSMEAYVEFNKLLTTYEKHDNIFSTWDINPFFHIALYNYYKAKGKMKKASNLKEEIMKHYYLITYKGVNVYSMSSNEDFTLECESNIYKGSAAWEVLRDLSISVVLNY